MYPFIFYALTDPLETTNEVCDQKKTCSWAVHKLDMIIKLCQCWLRKQSVSRESAGWPAGELHPSVFSLSDLTQMGFLLFK